MESVADFRFEVAETALDLFILQGYDQTSVNDIARGVGISRSTFFRQFGGKEDVIFADHEVLIDELEAFLATIHPDPWEAVCQAASAVFARFAERRETSQKRYRVVQGVPVLRDRETIMVSRYEKLFSDSLRRDLPGILPLEAIRFSTAVTATHNYVLREMMLGSPRGTLQTLEHELREVRRIFGVSSPQEPASASADDLIVAVFSRSTPAAEVARRIQGGIHGRFT